MVWNTEYRPRSTDSSPEIDFPGNPELGPDKADRGAQSPCPVLGGRSRL